MMAPNSRWLALLALIIGLVAIQASCKPHRHEAVSPTFLEEDTPLEGRTVHHHRRMAGSVHRRLRFTEGSLAEGTSRHLLMGDAAISHVQASGSDPDMVRDKLGSESVTKDMLGGYDKVKSKHLTTADGTRIKVQDAYKTTEHGQIRIRTDSSGNTLEVRSFVKAPDGTINVRRITYGGPEPVATDQKFTATRSGKPGAPIGDPKITTGADAVNAKLRSLETRQGLTPKTLESYNARIHTRLSVIGKQMNFLQKGWQKLWAPKTPKVKGESSFSGGSSKSLSTKSFSGSGKSLLPPKKMFFSGP